MKNRKHRFIFFGIISLFLVFPVWSQPRTLFRDVNKETLVYAVKDGKELFLDKYQPKKTSPKMPCVVFMFGGSFRSGMRNNHQYFDYFDDLSAKGYTVVSIDYRLGLKSASPRDAQEALMALKNAIDMAVDDLYDATNYILKHAMKWQVDPEKIIISGSSAGAIAVLQSEYERCNETTLASKLPAHFQYAGVIGFAGAVLSFDTLQYKNKPAPVLLFHGDCDDTVPFSKISMETVGFSGSGEISSLMYEAGLPYCLYQYVGSKHEIATSPMKNNLPEIQRFLELLVKEKQPLMLNVRIQESDKESTCPNLTIEDFIRSNFAHP
ncbi:MAG: alpha/beta hydrolase fold domain-containing protein [Bacteroidales bacterium]|jgi:predicted esterase|nr:alpha/beta hydrolase fold domain-containing protein [Bacteroidales bacterium]